jgi:hypothetical protein
LLLSTPLIPYPSPLAPPPSSSMPTSKKKGARVQLPSERQLTEALIRLGRTPGEWNPGPAGRPDPLRRPQKEVLLRQFVEAAASIDDATMAAMDDAAMQEVRERAERLIERIDRRRWEAAAEVQRHARGAQGRRRAAAAREGRAATVLQAVYRSLQSRYLATQLQKLRAVRRYPVVNFQCLTEVESRARCPEL